jgi:hypothetical protein
MDSFFSNALTQLGRQFPTLLIYMVGIGMGLACWRRSPKASFLVLLAMGIMLASTVMSIFLFWFVVEVGWGELPLDTVLSILFMAGNVFNAVGLALLLVAVYRRAPSPSEPAPGPAPAADPLRHDGGPDVRIRS